MSIPYTLSFLPPRDRNNSRSKSLKGEFNSAISGNAIFLQTIRADDHRSRDKSFLNLSDRSTQPCTRTCVHTVYVRSYGPSISFDWRRIVSQSNVEHQRKIKRDVQSSPHHTAGHLSKLIDNPAEKSSQVARRPPAKRTEPGGSETKSVPSKGGHRVSDNYRCPVVIRAPSRIFHLCSTSRHKSE